MSYQEKIMASLDSSILDRWNATQFKMLNDSTLRLTVRAGNRRATIRVMSESLEFQGKLGCTVILCEGRAHVHKSYAFLGTHGTLSKTVDNLCTHFFNYW